MFNKLTYTAFMQSLSPSSWFKFDETYGNTVSDSANSSNLGLINAADSSCADGAPMMGVAGAISGSTAFHFGTSATGDASAPCFQTNGGTVYHGSFVTITDNADASLVKVRDLFGRTVSSSANWGAMPSLEDGTPTGYSWTGINYNNTSYSVSGNKGIIDESASGTYGQYVSYDDNSDIQVGAPGLRRRKLGLPAPSIRSSLRADSPMQTTFTPLD